MEKIEEIRMWGQGLTLKFVMHFTTKLKLKNIFYFEQHIDNLDS